MNKQRIIALKYDVNKIYFLALDKTNGILYHVARKGSPSEDFYFLLYSYVTQDAKKEGLDYETHKVYGLS